MITRALVAAAWVLCSAPALAQDEPRFDAHGGDAGARLLPDDSATRATLAKAVRARGYYAGAPLGAGDCATCHADAAAQWASSAHRFSSFNNPYYRVSVEDFRRERGAKASRFCGGCHEPVAVATGLMDAPRADRASPAFQSGVTCLVCHSTTHTALEGNGRYFVDLRPLPTEKGPHGARVRPALMGKPRFCAGCHKVGLPESITQDRWLRGQNDYDAWHASGVAGQGAASVHRPPETKRCQDCHMPLEPAVLGDRAAKEGRIRSHRFLGANTALPHLRGDTDHEAKTAAFLAGKASLALVWSGATHVDAVLRARGVGHRFPGGTMDSNEVWLDVAAFDSAGRMIARSGGASPAGALPADTHFVRAQPVDDAGRPLRKRDPQHMRGVAFDAALFPSDPQLVRFQVPRETARVEARLLYRKFSAAYATRACALLPKTERARCADLPITEVAHAAIAAGAPVPDAPDLLVDWGLALADATAEHAERARAPLERARLLAPTRVEPLLGLGRLALRLGRTDDVLTLTAAARALSPTHPAPLFQQTRALFDAYRAQDMRAPAEQLAARLPDDRNALALLARARGLTGDTTGALAAADRLLVIDPESEEGHYQRALALRDLGRTRESDEALARYERHRSATEVDLRLRNQWRARRGTAPDESEPCHTHTLTPVADKQLL